MRHNFSVKALNRACIDNARRYYSSVDESQPIRPRLPMKTTRKQITQQVSTNKIRHHARNGLKKIMELGL